MDTYVITDVSNGTEQYIDTLQPYAHDLYDRSTHDRLQQLMPTDL